jgi:GTP pyrophosphokinase
VIAVAWGLPRGDKESLYPVDVLVEAGDRQGLLRDISEVFAKEKMNVTNVNTQSTPSLRGGTAHMKFTVEVADSARLQQVLGQVMQVEGVRSARRR